LRRIRPQQKFNFGSSTVQAACAFLARAPGVVGAGRISQSPSSKRSIRNVSNPRDRERSLRHVGRCPSRPRPGEPDVGSQERRPRRPIFDHEDRPALLEVERHLPRPLGLELALPPLHAQSRLLI
jgi:hypothetical protein